MYSHSNLTESSAGFTCLEAVWKNGVNDVPGV